MKDKKLTNLQFTLLQSLESKGVVVDGEGTTIAINDTSVCVTTKNSYSDYISYEKNFISVNEVENTIAISSCSECSVVEDSLDSILDSTVSLKKTSNRTFELYRVLGGDMRYLKVSAASVSKIDSSGETVLGLSPWKKEKSRYLLPDGYQITEGILPFVSNKEEKKFTKFRSE